MPRPCVADLSRKVLDHSLTRKVARLATPGALQAFSSLVAHLLIGCSKANSTRARHTLSPSLPPPDLLDHSLSKPFVSNGVVLVCPGVLVQRPRPGHCTWTNQYPGLEHWPPLLQCPSTQALMRPSVAGLADTTPRKLATQRDSAFANGRTEGKEDKQIG